MISFSSLCPAMWKKIKDASLLEKWVIAIIILFVVGVIIAAGIWCHDHVKLSMWQKLARPLVPVLGIGCAAMLIRTMRSFPITDPDSFNDVEAIENLKETWLGMIGALFVLTFWIMGILLALFILMAGHVTLPLIFEDERIYSGIIGLFMAYLGIMFPLIIICSDQHIITKQAEGVRTAFEQREKREKREHEREKREHEREKREHEREKHEHKREKRERGRPRRRLNVT